MLAGCAFRDGAVDLAGSVAEYDARCPPIFRCDAHYFGVETDRQIWIVLLWRNIGIGCRASFAMSVHELIKAGAALRIAIEVGIEGFAK